MNHPSEPSQRRQGVRRTLLSLLATLGLLTSVAVAQTTIDFWSPFTGPDGETIEAMVESFNTTTGQEAGVEVNLLIVPWDEYYTKLTVAMASRQAPNLAIAHSHRIAGFAAEGALAPFTPDQLEQAGIKGEDFIPALWNAGEIDGNRYAVPIDAFPRHLFYNRALFEQAGLDPDQPPQDLESLIEDAQRISDLGDDIYGLYFAQEGSWVARDFYAIYWQFANDLLAPDLKSVSTDFEQAATKTLELMTKFKGDGLTPQQNVEYQPLFLQGKIGIAFAQITDLPLFQNVADFDYSVAPFPTLGDQPATFALGHNFIIPLGQNDEALAADMTFVRWFSENSLDWTKGGKVPASFTVLNSPEFADLPDQSTVASQLDIMRLPPTTIAQQPTIDRIVQETIEAVYGGQLSVEAAVTQMSQGIDEALAE